jgi:hypothetical protein
MPASIGAAIGVCQKSLLRLNAAPKHEAARRIRGAD